MNTTLQEALLDEVGRLVRPLTDAATSGQARRELLGALGFDLDVVPGLDIGPLLSALQQLASLAGQLESTPGPLTLQEAIDGLVAGADAFVAVRSLVQGLSTSGLPPDLVDRLAEAGEDLVDYLVLRWLRDAHPHAHAVLSVLGLVDLEIPSAPAVSYGSSFAYLPTVRGRLNVQRLFQLLNDPVGTLKAQYLDGRTGQEAVDALATRLWPVVVRELQRLEWPVAPANNPEVLALIGADLGTAGTQLANSTLLLPVAVDANGEAVVLALTLLAAQAPGERSLLAMNIEGEITRSVTIGAWTLEATVSGATPALAVDSAGTIILPTGADPSGSVSFTLTISRSADPAGPALRIGGATGSRVEVDTIGVTLQIDLKTGDPVTAQIELAVSGARVVVDFSDGDGFLRYLADTLLGGPVHAEADVVLGWSRRRGVYLQAGGSASTNGPRQLQARIPADLDLGPIRIPAISVTADPSGTDLTCWAGIEATVTLGPVVATIVGLGIQVRLSAPGGGGNLGPLDLQLGLQPPTGVGLSITGPGVSGTGFLQQGPEPGDYLGAMALKLGDVSIDAVGVLTTRLPGGHGFSLVVLASVEFPPVALGFGFALVGIGGLVGVNRTMDVPKLQLLARSGGLDDLMFPADLAHNAPRVAHDLEAYFPPADGQLVIGPTARLIWGEGGWLTADLAVLVELPLPVRVALLGTIHIALPTPDAAVADMTLDVLGIVDFAASTLSIDAGLRDSKLGGFTLTGQAALRARFGDQPTFVLAIGGFNPHFAAPTGFPALNRIALSAGTDSTRVRMAAYFAITPNTLQFGAMVDLFASLGIVSVAASLTFDALVQHKPLLVRVDVTISAAIVVDSTPLLTMGLDLHIVGPGPWKVTGQAVIHVLSWSCTVPIDLTVGSPAPPLPPASVDVLDRLLAALTDTHNWQTSSPAGPGIVSVRGGDANDLALVHPLDQLTVRERVVPLRVVVDRLGPDALATPCVLDVVSPKLNAVSTDGSLVTDYFAMAQFVTMTDAEKLSAPSFDQLGAGLTIGVVGMQVPDEASVGVVVTSARTWTTMTVDAPDAPAAQLAAAAAPTAGLTVSVGTTTAPVAALVARQLGGAAAALNGASGAGAAAYAGPPSGISVTTPSYAAARPDPRVTLAPVRDQQGAVVRVPSYLQTLDRITGAAAGLPSVEVIFSSELPGSTPAGVGA